MTHIPEKKNEIVALPKKCFDYLNENIIKYYLKCVDRTGFFLQYVVVPPTLFCCVFLQYLLQHYSISASKHGHFTLRCVSHSTSTDHRTTY